MEKNIKVGDKVRYLNSVGGGIVSSFKGKDIVLVEEDDGFETPCLVSELVVVKDTNEYNFPIENNDRDIHKGIEVMNSDIDSEIVDEPSIPAYTWNERNETKEGELLTIYLAFVPKDIKQLQTTDVEMYIVNDSNYYIQFAIINNKEEASLRCQNMVEPQTKLYLESINKLALNDLENLRFQGYAYKNISFEPKPVLDVSLKINPTKFYKLHSFRQNDYFDDDAMLISIITDDVMDFASVIDQSELQKAIMSKNDEGKVFRKSIRKKERSDILEIDLHINELIDNTNGLTRSDMLNYQIETFQKVMNENLKKKGQKIVFIHGKGEGVLRAEIEKILKKKYYKCKFQDASFQQYGFGATQVTIY